MKERFNLIAEIIDPTTNLKIAIVQNKYTFECIEKDGIEFYYRSFLEYDIDGNKSIIKEIILQKEYEEYKNSKSVIHSTELFELIAKYKGWNLQ